PWLAYGVGDDVGIQRATDLVDLIDELMDREDELYTWAVPWPLADVAGVVADVLVTLTTGFLMDTQELWEERTRVELTNKYTEVAAALGCHEDCCTEVLINVHWW